MVYGQGKVEKKIKSMKVGTLSKLAGVSRDTVRLYEKLGLLKDISRPYEYNNYKEYGEENVKRIHLIKQMQTFGITLKESKEILDALDRDEINEHKIKELLLSKIAEIDARIGELIEIKALLEKNIRRCDEGAKHPLK